MIAPRVFAIGALIALASLAACDGGSFSGGGGKAAAPKEAAKPQPPQPPPGGDPGGGTGDGKDGKDGKGGDPLGQESEPGDGKGAKDGEPGDETDVVPPAEPDGLIELQGETVAPPDLTTCVSLPTQGKQGYGKCPAGSVVVVVNDGKAQEQTCCPLKGKNILSDKPNEQYIARTGNCLIDEVTVGMTDPHAPAMLCSRLNPKLKTGTRTTAIYAAGANLSPVMNQIAQGYNVGDTCICPEGLVHVGGHTASDNTCADQCAKIVKK